MNDFGSNVAPLVAYLPNSNKDTSNLQWAVRTDGGKRIFVLFKLFT